MGPIATALSKSQHEWDELFNNHRMKLVTSVSTDVLEWVEGLTLMSITTQHRMFQASFQKDEDDYTLKLFFDHFGSCSRIQYSKSGQVVFSSMNDSSVNTSLSPFFQKTVSWLIRNVECMNKAKKEQELEEINQQFRGKLVENIIQNEQGQWVLVMDGKPTPFVWKG